MRIEWDEAKRQSNLFKHGFDFVDAAEVLEGTAVVLLEDLRYSDDRWIAFGYHDSVVVQIAFQQRGRDSMRIISMRRASRRERSLFVKELINACIPLPKVTSLF